MLVYGRKIAVSRHILLSVWTEDNTKLISVITMCPDESYYVA